MSTFTLAVNPICPLCLGLERADHTPWCPELEANNRQSWDFSTFRLYDDDTLNLRHQHSPGPFKIEALTMGHANRLRFRIHTHPETSPGPSTTQTPGTIYYLATSIPHLKEMSVAGPYNTLEGMYSRAVLSFGNECWPGIFAMLGCIRFANMGGAIDLVSSPIDNDPDKIKQIRFISQANPSLAASIPCPIWTVYSYEHDGYRTNGVGNVGRYPRMGRKKIDIEGSFLSEAAGKEMVKTVVDEKMGAMSVSAVYGGYMGSSYVAFLEDDQTGTAIAAVMLSYDDGTAPPWAV